MTSYLIIKEQIVAYMKVLRELHHIPRVDLNNQATKKIHKITKIHLV
jgi:hypothetical protein